MKTLTILITLFATQAMAQQYYVNEKPVTKTEALIALVKQPDAKVVKCQEQELSKKATIVNK